MWLNLTWFTVRSKRKCCRKLGLTWSIISEHLFPLPQSISFSSLLRYLAVSFDTTVFPSVVSDAAGLPPGRCLLGSWGRGHWGGKALVACAVHREQILAVFTPCEGRWEEGNGGRTLRSRVRNGNPRSSMACEIKPPNGNTLRNGSEV